MLGKIHKLKIRIVYAILVIFTSFIIVSCSNGNEDRITYRDVSYEILQIIYETDDGIWDASSVDNMVSRYYEGEKAGNIYVEITITFKTEEDFIYAEFNCNGGIGEYLGMHEYARETHTERIGSKEEGGEVFSAGIHHITMACFFTFYKTDSVFGRFPACDLEEVFLKSNLLVLTLENV